ncbi:acetyl-CoA C-acetyltransferase [Candidatus Acetothermia bacterium]|jgi:acetyl-CoA C-acetyltransferase|nr:acetyl-CoA C-acetyltransferase [Candidatus Acetothermia bacterium]MCI2427406.1 acetyl-CoA C-acetyltransferase [Candidatus Acetothermia bacterium]MCI2428561.1 acetyl-CoA C-acetyltransferase [Candidatus Acetothermia bacterium]
MPANKTVIVAGLRTAIGSFGKSLKDIPAPRLGAAVITALLAQTKIETELIDEVIFGNVLSGGLGMNPARQAAVYGGIPYKVPAYTVNRVCGSGLQAIIDADRLIRLNQAEIVIAGGMEGMSSTPYILPQARWGARMNDFPTIDMMRYDGLWDVFYSYPMGVTAENLAVKYNISRKAQDDFAYHSQMKATRAQVEGRFQTEITPINIPQRKGDPIVFAVDEHPRSDVTLERLASLRPEFKAEGTVTAGNSSGINDGAAAVLVMSSQRAKELRLKPLAEITTYSVTGVDPAIMGIGPVNAIRSVLHQADVKINDIDLVELNEAFAVQSLAVLKEVPINEKKLNVNGGAIALGHPIGATGARLSVSLLHEMVKRDAKLGLVAMCIGGGMGIAAIFTR